MRIRRSAVRVRADERSLPRLLGRDEGDLNVRKRERSMAMKSFKVSFESYNMKQLSFGPYTPGKVASKNNSFLLL